MASYTDSLNTRVAQNDAARDTTAGRWQAAKQSTLGRFLAVGGVSFVVNQALLYVLYEQLLGRHIIAETGLLRHVDGGLLLASAIALEVSILVRFALNDSWTFRGRGSRSYLRRLAQSNLSSFGGPVIALVAVNVLTPALGISYLAANAIGIVLGLAWNWSWSSRVVWRQRPELAAEVAS